VAEVDYIRLERHEHSFICSEIVVDIIKLLLAGCSYGYSYRYKVSILARAGFYCPFGHVSYMFTYQCSDMSIKIVLILTHGLD